MATTAEEDGSVNEFGGSTWGNVNPTVSICCFGEASFFGDSKTPSGFVSVTSDFQEKWDLLLILLLLFVLFVTPYEVCFLSRQTVKDPLFWVNRAVDTCFVGDMILQFFLFPQEMEIRLYAGDVVDLSGLRLTLAYNYFKGWFFLDFISILPYDFFTWWIENSLNTDDAEVLRVIRIVRLTRLVKVLRVLRASRVLARYDDRVGISFIHFRIMKYCLLTMVWGHWCACLIRLTALLDGNPTDNWIYAYFGLVPDEVPPERAYLAAFYWSMATVTSVGFGDLVPKSTAEVFVTNIILVLASLMMAFWLGFVNTLISGIDIADEEYFRLREMLNEFTRSVELPDNLKYKLRNYIRRRYHSGLLIDWGIILDRLSAQLRDEVASCMNTQWLKGNPYFKDADRSELAAMATSIQGRIFCKGEALVVRGDMPDTLYLIRQGLVLSEGQIQGKNGLIGEDMLYFVVRKAVAESESNISGVKQVHLSLYETALNKVKNDELDKHRSALGHAHACRREYKAMAMCYTVANQISEEDMLQVFSAHPRLLRRVARQVVRMTMRMHILAYSKAFKLVYPPLGEEGPSVLARSNLDSELVGWYRRKLEVLKPYKDEVTLAKLVVLQRAVRACLGRMRFRKVCAILSRDPQIMHRNVFDAISNVARLVTVRCDLVADLPDPCPNRTGVLSPVKSMPTKKETHGTECRVEMNKAMIEHCEEQIQSYQQILHSAKNDLEAANRELIMTQQMREKLIGIPFSEL